MENDGLNLDESLAGFSEAEAAELRPILEMICQVAVLADETPPPVNKALNREKFLAEMYELGDAPIGVEPIHSQPQAATMSWVRSRFARAAAGVAAAAILSGGVAVAAGTSGPDSSLYPIKRAVERVETALPRSDYAAAKLHIGLARTRLDELAAGDRRGATFERLSDEFRSELSLARTLARGLSEMERREITGDADRLEGRYQGLLDPPSTGTPGTEGVNNRPKPPKPSEAEGAKGDDSGDRPESEIQDEGSENDGREGDSNKATEINSDGQEGNSTPENETPQVSEPDEPEDVAPDKTPDEEKQEEVKPPDESQTEADSDEEQPD